MSLFAPWYTVTCWVWLWCLPDPAGEQPYQRVPESKHISGCFQQKSLARSLLTAPKWTLVYSSLWHKRWHDGCNGDLLDTVGHIKLPLLKHWSGFWQSTLTMSVNTMLNFSWLSATQGGHMLSLTSKTSIHEHIYTKYSHILCPWCSRFYLPLYKYPFVLLPFTILTGRSRWSYL